MTSQVATLLVQAVGAIFIGVVFAHFQRAFQHAYLRHWTACWLVTGAWLVGAALSNHLRETGSTVTPWYVLATVSTTGAGLMRLAWLLLGAFEVTAGRGVDKHFARRLVIGAALFGIVTTLVLVGDGTPHVTRAFARTLLRAILAASAFGVASNFVLRARRWNAGLGHRMVGGSFLLYALQQIHYIGIAIYGYTNGVSMVGYTPYLNIVDFLLQFAMALGMVIWLLEDERRAALDAATQIEHLAYHDALTGLPNRQLFLDRLDVAVAGAQRSGAQLAVFFLDLDRFKLINDSLGHSVGDKLLQVVSRRMRALLRDEDTVTRIGGDEFTVLVARVDHVDDATSVARRVREAIKLPIVIDGRELFVTASIGISVYPNDGEDAETLLRNADTAMYRAKTQGRDTLQLYADGPALAASGARAAVARFLHRALRDDGPHRADRRMGVAYRVQSARQVAGCRPAESASLRQPLRAPAAAARLRASRLRDPAPVGHRSADARARAHRKHGDAERLRHARQAA
jgi:diguanylate cyclase (GGDEF)-like protein